MIYQIEFKKDIDFISTMKSINKIGSYCFFENFFYVYTNSRFKTIENKFKEQYLSIIVIDNSNYNNINSNTSKYWCKDKLEKEALKKFENSKQGQARLNYVMKFLDIVEERKKKGDVEDYNS